MANTPTLMANTPEELVTNEDIQLYEMVSQEPEENLVFNFADYFSDEE